MRTDSYFIFLLQESHMDLMLGGSSLQKGYIKIKRLSYAFYSRFKWRLLSLA